jgi:hypothetical protein
MKLPNIDNIINDWYDSVGVRLVAPQHGSAIGHEWYLKQSVKYGINIGLGIAAEILKENDPTKTEKV